MARSLQPPPQWIHPGETRTTGCILQAIRTGVFQSPKAVPSASTTRSISHSLGASMFRFIIVLLPCCVVSAFAAPEDVAIQHRKYTLKNEVVLGGVWYPQHAFYKAVGWMYLMPTSTISSWRCFVQTSPRAGIRTQRPPLRRVGCGTRRVRRGEIRLYLSPANCRLVNSPWPTAAWSARRCTSRYMDRRSPHGAKSPW